MAIVDADGYIQATNISHDQGELLKAAEAYVNKLIADGHIFTDKKFRIDLNTNQNSAKAGFTYDIALGEVNLPTPGKSANDRIPVHGISGYTNSTFMIYDTAVAAAHETGHIILGALGMELGAPDPNSQGGLLNGQELPNAVLASVGRDAIAAAGSIDNYATADEYYLAIANEVRDYFELSGTERVLFDPSPDKLANILTRASQLNASYENIFNANPQNDLYGSSGLNQSPSGYRAGYISHAGQGVLDAHNQWKTYPEGSTDYNTPGRRDNLVLEGTGIAWLGNQYDNTMIIGEDPDFSGVYNEVFDGGGNDYVDGGKGNDHIHGGKGNDELYGGEGVDFLEGGEGADTLNGGAGNDSLNGGNGFDTYEVGDPGIDIIGDEDGSGEIIYGGGALTGGKEIAPNTHKSDDETITYNFIPEGDQGSGTLVITTPDGIKVINNFTEGDFGISFSDPDPVENIQTQNTIEGDGKPLDTDLTESGIQYDYDQFGNILLEDGNVATIDFLRGSGANDEILPGAEDDGVRAYGGDDIVRGGTGEDGCRPSCDTHFNNQIIFS